MTKVVTDLSKKIAVFDWTPLCDEAFKALKYALTSAPVLTLPDASKPFELVCDASGCGIGAVLPQQDRPLAYYPLGETQKLLDLTQTGRLWPVCHRSHLFRIRLDSNLANDVAKVGQLSLTPNILRRSEEDLMLA